MHDYFPSKSDFHDRLKRNGWQFAFSYALLFLCAIWQGNVSPFLFLLIGLVVTALNLAQTALTAGAPHLDGMLAKPDMTTMPGRKRYTYYVIEGLHWSAVMVVVFASSLNGRDVVIWLVCGQLFALGMGFFSERALRKQA
ncbi:hypothetical protein [uncultured Sulfitobacter sp.]|uniref:hypothetical protein n=1 Tax=uncultured Sulfitobacter sp. TaxID=191468 RepID=UPI002606C4E8|nr:hypothetical protein [uncultured Sulfitobacter sp.]